MSSHSGSAATPTGHGGAAGTNGVADCPGLRRHAGRRRHGHDRCRQHLGAILAVCGYIGWFRDVLPHEKMESVPVADIPQPVSTSRRQVERVEFMHRDLHRARLPLEIYPVSAGVKGGLAGGVAMAVLAMMYGIVSGHSIWYPINLLSAGFFPAIRTTAQIAAFQREQPDHREPDPPGHLAAGRLLYGAMLPMFPRRPILLGGVIAPVLWSGLLHSVLEFINPVLNQRIDWPWFVISQIGFGVVAGIVVSRQERIPPGNLFPSPFAKAWRRRERSTRRTKGLRGEELGRLSSPSPSSKSDGRGVQQFPRAPWAEFGSPCSARDHGLPFPVREELRGVPWPRGKGRSSTLARIFLAPRDC